MSFAEQSDPVTPDTIKADLEALQQTVDATTAYIAEIESGIQIEQSQLDAMHASITGMTAQLNDAIATR